MNKYKAVEVRREDVHADCECQDGAVIAVCEDGTEKPYAVVYNAALNRYLAIVPVVELEDFTAIFGW